MGNWNLFVAKHTTLPSSVANDDRVCSFSKKWITFVFLTLKWQQILQNHSPILAGNRGMNNNDLYSGQGGGQRVCRWWSDGDLSSTHGGCIQLNQIFSFISVPCDGSSGVISADMMLLVTFLVENWTSKQHLRSHSRIWWNVVVF